MLGSRSAFVEERAAVRGRETHPALRYWPSLVIFALFAWNGLRRRGFAGGAVPESFLARASPASAGLARISIAYAPSARRRLQVALRELASRTAPTQRDRHWLALDVTELLRGELASATHVFVESRTIEESLESRFRATTQELRSRFRHETRGRGAASPELRGHAEEGDGFLVVSMVLADRSALPSIQSPRDATEVSTALERILPTRGGLTAVDVIWSPSEELDRMSSAELEILYPELTRLPGAIVGERRCAACGARHAAELARCPGCGSPTAV